MKNNFNFMKLIQFSLDYLYYNSKILNFINFNILFHNSNLIICKKNTNKKIIK